VVGSSQGCHRAEEDFEEQNRLRGGGPTGTTLGEKGKFEDSKATVAQKHVKQALPGQGKGGQ